MIAVYRSARLELRSAEPRLFPQVPGNQSPTCSFIIEPAIGPYRVNTSILFQTTSSDSDGTIIRYAWEFGDGTRSDQPDEEHHYGAANTYTVTHGVTDDDGGQTTCTQTVTVSGFNEMLVAVQLSPNIDTGGVFPQTLSRCITFEFWECPGVTPAETVDAVVTFTITDDLPNPNIARIWRLVPSGW